MNTPRNTPRPRAIASAPVAALAVATACALLSLAGPAPAADQAQPMPSVVAPGAKLEKLSSDYKFTEGPAADKDGNVYFTDQPNDQIVKWSAADGKLSVFMKPAGRSNGMCFDARGNLISCADEKNELWSIDINTRQPTVLVKDYNGKLLDGPNDVWVHPSGAIYFTDPIYKRAWWKHRDPAPQQDKRAVYRLSADGKTLARADDNFKMPNGIIGTPDGKTLYVADIGDKKTYSYTIKDDGTLADRKLFCEMGSDGMTIDTAGNVYLTGKGVPVFDKTGNSLGTIPVPEGWTANVCFGGKAMDTLFITAGKSVYTIKMAVKGAGSQ